MPNFAEYITRRMEEEGLNQSETAKLLGIPDTSVNRLVRGSVYPRDATIDKFAKLFNFDPKLFYGGGYHPAPEKAPATKAPVQDFAVPSYVFNGWQGAELALVYEETLSSVVRLEFSVDGERFFPVNLHGRMKVYVGKDLPEWADKAQAVFYDNIHAWRYTLRNGEQSSHDVQGLHFYLAILEVDPKKGS